MTSLADSLVVTSSTLRIGYFALAVEVLPAIWIIDSGASHHMYNGTDFITYGRLPNPIQIQLGDKTSVLATHHGSLRVQNHRINALHTPSFRYSLLSVSELDSSGYYIKFRNGKCSIQDPQNPSVTIMTGSRNGQLYQVDPIFSRYSDRSNSFALLGSANLLLSTTESHLWHRRLAHLNHVSMKSLIDGYMPTDICETCILAKHERKIIRVPVLRTSIPFELVHSDTCGPFTTKSLSGGLHFIVFIDDYTLHTTVYILTDKRAETCVGAFQCFKAKIENWGYNIKRFRCDNGRGEYDNTLFRRILTGSGISYKPSPPYTQHKNGIAE